MLLLEYLWPFKDFPGDPREHRRNIAQSLERTIQNQQRIVGNRFKSANQTITLAGTLTLAHGLLDMPNIAWAALENTTTELGYPVGDVVFASLVDFSIVPDATNLNIRYASVAPTIPNKTTGVKTAITPASWEAIFYAEV